MFCKRSTELEKQLRDRAFNTRYSKQKKWFIVYYQNHPITFFPVSKWVKNWQLSISLKMNLQKNHFEPQKMQLLMTSSLQRQRLYFQKRTFAFVWISKWQFQNVSMAIFFRALVFLGVIDVDYRGSVESPSSWSLHI